MFSPATVNVLPFDPRRGADQARQYAGKYASKPEKWYYLETERDGVKDFLQCRTVGLCMTHNRLLNFHVVRSTRPVQFTPASFVPDKNQRTLRDPSHIATNPDYPDPVYYLNHTQKCLFRSEQLRHLRVEQFNRYFSLTGDNEACTIEDTLGDEEDVVAPEPHHRHFDSAADEIQAGSSYPAIVKHVNGARRRQQARLGVSRVPFIEPLGAKRESFYEAKLLLGLPWYCTEWPSKECDSWTFVWDPPVDIGGAHINGGELKIAPELALSFEQHCADLEKDICKHDHNLICECCAEELGSLCKACRFAVGFHYCQNPEGKHHCVWRKGTLFAGHVDIYRVMFNLHRKGLPTQTLKEKVQEYIDASLLTAEQGDVTIRIIEGERSVHRMVNEETGEEQPAAAIRLTHRLSHEQMTTELRDREDKMTAGGIGGETDQWRVYQHIIGCIERDEYLRLMIQASAGTGVFF